MTDNPFGHIEADANARLFATQVRTLYVALVQEGFTEQQALIMLGQMLGVGIATHQGGGGQ